MLYKLLVGKITIMTIEEILKDLEVIQKKKLLQLKINNMNTLLN